MGAVRFGHGPEQRVDGGAAGVLAGTHVRPETNLRSGPLHRHVAVARRDPCAAAVEDVAVGRLHDVKR